MPAPETGAHVVGVIFNENEREAAMRNRTGYIALLVYAVWLLISAGMAACQSGSGGPDDWEAYHNSYQPPDSVMDAVGVRPGMTVAEVGAGRGRYIVHMALRVGAAGKVYANDIDEEALDYVELRCKRDSIGNVVTILGELTDPLLPEGELDIVYMINTYHHLEKPVELMRNIAPSLKPDGVLAIIEHDPVKYPRAGSHSTARDVLVEQAEKAGFELVRIETFLPRDNINIFRPKRGSESRG
jgi:SAM-dependent methyltransferase